MSSINSHFNFVFVHVPKTAGTSMEKIFPGGGHSTLHDYSSQCDLEKYFKWTFIRNPYDRVASFFFNIRTWVGTEGLIKEKYKEDLESFILELDQWVVIDPKYNTKYDYHKYPIHLFPIDYFILTDNHKMDFIGYFEKLEKDWVFIKNKFNIDKPLNHDNKSKGLSSYQDLYTADMKKVIQRIYQSDFKYYPKLK